MKKTLYIIAIITAFVSCKTAPKKDFVVLKGTVINQRADHFKVNSITSSFNKEIPINEDGTFLDTLRVKEENLMIYDGSNITYAYIEAGNDLSLNYDAEDYKNTIKFTGNGAEINNYLVQKRNRENEILKGSGNVFELNETDFVTKQKEVEAELLKLLGNTQNLPDYYITKEKRNIKYMYLSKLNNYESYHAHYTKNPDFKVSNGFLKEIEDLNYNSEEDFSFSYAYNTLVSAHCTIEAQKLSEAESIPQDVAYLKSVNKLTNQNIKNYLLYKHAKYGITYTSSLEPYYQEFIAGSTNAEHVKEITDSYNVLKTVAPGQPSPKFVNYENNAGGTTSLDDLKGKYVYIDVGATWCGPCKAEIPFLKEVEEKYHDKNIAFVSISVDQAKDHDKWKKMIVEKELGGIQLMADNDFKSQFIKDYFIKGIPKFILLDPNGNIIDSNAPRPSNKDLIEVFNTLNL